MKFIYLTFYNLINKLTILVFLTFTYSSYSQSFLSLPTAKPIVTKVKRGEGTEIELEAVSKAIRVPFEFIIREYPQNGKLNLLRKNANPLENNKIVYYYQNDPNSTNKYDYFKYAVRQLGKQVSSSSTVKIFIKDQEANILAPKHISFGKIHLFQKKQQFINLQNTGSKDTIAKIFTQHPFKIDDKSVLKITIPKKSTISVPITASPNTTGITSQLLFINYLQKQITTTLKVEGIKPFKINNINANFSWDNKQKSYQTILEIKNLTDDSHNIDINPINSFAEKFILPPSVGILPNESHQVKIILNPKNVQALESNKHIGQISFSLNDYNVTTNISLNYNKADLVISDLKNNNLKELIFDDKNNQHIFAVKNNSPSNIYANIPFVKGFLVSNESKKSKNSLNISNFTIPSKKSIKIKIVKLKNNLDSKNNSLSNLSLTINTNSIPYNLPLIVKAQEESNKVAEKKKLILKNPLINEDQEFNDEQKLFGNDVKKNIGASYGLNLKKQPFSLTIPKVKKAKFVKITPTTLTIKIQNPGQNPLNLSDKKFTQVKNYKKFDYIFEIRRLAKDKKSGKIFRFWQNIKDANISLTKLPSKEKQPIYDFYTFSNLKPSSILYFRILTLDPQTKLVSLPTDSSYIITSSPKKIPWLKYLIFFTMLAATTVFLWISGFLSKFLIYLNNLYLDFKMNKFKTILKNKKENISSSEKLIINKIRASKVKVYNKKPSLQRNNNEVLEKTTKIIIDPKPKKDKNNIISKINKHTFFKPRKKIINMSDKNKEKNKLEKTSKIDTLSPKFNLRINKKKKTIKPS